MKRLNPESFEASIVAWANDPSQQWDGRRSIDNPTSAELRVSAAYLRQFIKGSDYDSAAFAFAAEYLDTFAARIEAQQP